MRLSKTFALLPALLSGCVSGALVRRTIVEAGGLINSPAAGTTVASGATFTSSYGVRNQCHSGYSPVNFYLLAGKPSTTDVSSSGTFTDPLFHFGNYLVPNFGLPAMSNPPPPPATFTMPDLEGVGDTEVHFAVVETFLGCPPDGHTEYGLSANALQYDA
ncbi:hypothetical protein BXZ70DRAFT_910246 [Cristinia sonorae]|uniref:Lipoprotein n=1 Tax=Cristinia sonorae TaxID=1940300 RepID=A0A8K0XLL2_9AGAR|nr:hypothetical protein BXZ70DRAFT_910246 [Cristinia sonorae]